jgi:carbamoylphosphate synthase small subunit
VFNTSLTGFPEILTAPSYHGQIVTMTMPHIGNYGVTADDRGRFGELLQSLEIDHPAWGMAHSQQEALEIVHRIGYPVLVRPSFVLGGRAMAYGCCL